ncbi:MAG: hypothetical protein ACYDFT_08985, partial [Thermoplasmata archaeon]
SIPYAILISIASGIRRTSILLHASVLALVANIGLSILLVPRFGMTGAAIGNSSMYWIAFLVLYIELRGTGMVRLDAGSIARIWAASLAMFLTIAVPLVLLHYRPVLVPVFIGLGVLVFILSLRLTRAVPGDVANALVRFLPRWASVVGPVICWSAACGLCRHEEQWRGTVAPVEAFGKVD